VFRVSKVLKEFKVHRACKVPKGYRELLEFKVYKVRKEFKAP